MERRIYKRIPVGIGADIISDSKNYGAYFSFSTRFIQEKPCIYIAGNDGSILFLPIPS
jgi:hypothetical protein